jgi:coenzyme F420-reducing hydrogenase beta subunit
MKTILVVYSNVKVSENCKLKRYAFNTDADVKVGEMLKTDSYDTNLVIVRVLEEAFKYYSNGGKLSNVFNNTGMADVKTLKIVTTFDDTVNAVKIED